MEHPTPRIRDARDDDADGLIALLGAVFSEYPGCVLEVDGEMPELRAIATAYRDWGGGFWVAEQGSSIVGSIGWTPSLEPGGVELRKLYLLSALRGGGLGASLAERVERVALERGAGFVDLWSDTRFERAHRFYEKRGYVRGPHTRALHDLSNSIEYYLRKEL